MKFETAFYIAFSFSIAATVEAQETLHERIPPCFAVAARETESCKAAKKCSVEKINQKLKSCVSSLKLQPDWCNYQRCWFSDASATFPQTKDCQLRIESTSAGDGIEAIISAKNKGKKACIVDHFSLGKAELRVENATYQESKKWHLATAMLPLTFEKIVTSKQIEPVEFEDMNNVIAVVSAGFYCDASKADEVLPNSNSNNKKSVRYDFCPARHFTGRNGITGFTFISKFLLKEKVQICGVALAAGTQMRFRINSASEAKSASEDGAVTLTGFPLDQFPNLKKKRASDSGDTAILCRPGANLDWKNCSCAYGMSDADFDSME